MGLIKCICCLLIVISMIENYHTAAYFLTPDDNDCGNETYLDKEKCSSMMVYERNLGKYRNFFANLLEEDTQEFAVEIQELYNMVSSALVESNLNKRQRMFYYSKWLIEKTDDLEAFLLSKGLKNIVPNP